MLGVAGGNPRPPALSDNPEFQHVFLNALLIFLGFFTGLRGLELEGLIHGRGRGILQY